MSAQPVLGDGRPVIAIDIGGTTIKGVLVDASGSIGRSLRVATPTGARDAADVIDAVAQMATQLDPSGSHPLGLAVAGIVDEAAGIAKYSRNIGWRDVPMRQVVAERTRRRVAVVHDVRGSGLAEARVGAGAGLSDVIVVTIGTGISAAILSGGVPIVRGGYAGELGQTCVWDARAGRRVVLEELASASAIATRYAAVSGERVDGARAVLARAQLGDAAAIAVWNEAVEALADVLSVTTALLAPEAIIIAGGLSEAGDALIRPLGGAIEARYSLTRVAVRRAQLGERAGLIGAAIGAREMTA